MDVLLAYVDSGGPSRYLHNLSCGTCLQVLKDAGLQALPLHIASADCADELINAYEGFRPHVVAFYLDEFNLSETSTITCALRSAFPDAVLAALGVLTVLAPDKIMEACCSDYLVIGEPEIPLFELISAVRTSADIRQIKNLWWKNQGHLQRNPLRPLIENLDTLPFADRTFVDAASGTSCPGELPLYILASRGCPYTCHFCHAPQQRRAYEGKGTFYRFRSPANVVSEISSALRQRNHSSICFTDDIFPTDRFWLDDFGRRMKAAHAPTFSATVSVEALSSETLQQLASSGCREIVLGMETGNEAFRKRIAARNLKTEALQSVISEAKALGIMTRLNVMTGLPLESAALLEETWQAVRASGADRVSARTYYAVPGTPFFEYSSEKGYSADKNVQPADFSKLNLQLPEISADAAKSMLLRMQFLNIFNALKRLPPQDDGESLLLHLPKAKLKLQHSGAVDVCTTTSLPESRPYLSMETESELRIALNAYPCCVIELSLALPEVALRQLNRCNAQLLLEVAWVCEGQEQRLFTRLIDSREVRLASHWQDQLIAGPEDGGQGELVLRLTGSPESVGRTCLLLGNPRVRIPAATTPSDGTTAAPLPTDQSFEMRARELEQQLAAALSARKNMQEERDSKVKRNAELQMRILELEKQLEQLAAPERADDAGIGDKLRNLMFRK